MIKSDLRCFVALAGMLPAIGYVHTCSSNTPLPCCDRVLELGCLEESFDKKVVVTDVFVGTLIICALCVLPKSALI